VLIVQGILSKLVALINSLPVYWLILRVFNPAVVSGKSEIPVNYATITIIICV